MEVEGERLDKISDKKRQNGVEHVLLLLLLYIYYSLYDHTTKVKYIIVLVGSLSVFGWLALAGKLIAIIRDDSHNNTHV